MWFVDHAKITVKGGDGGRGCPAFAQPPYTRFPYPDGGDGGDGGDVSILADRNVATLLDFHFRHEFAAGAGRHGGSNKKTGKRGDDRVIRVPVGTVILEADSGAVLWDLTRSGEQVIAARGGRGGVGNATRSASLTSCRPRPEGPRPEGARHSVRGRAGSRAELRGAAEAKPGSPGEQRQLILELKLVADVGLVGFPNAGKSSLLARISTAHPKIGAYPFTTRYPVLGVVNVEGRGSFIACDIPGLIEGAHQGKGLGIQFLRHIERTRMLLHVVDLAAVDGRDPEAAFHQLNRELTEYRLTLGQRPQLIVANKLDLPEARARLDAFTHAVQRPVWPISCATGAGIPALLEAVWKALGSIGESAR